MDNELDHIIEGIESGLTGDFEIDATMLQNAMEQFKDHPAATEIARECGRILYEILPEDRKDDLHSAMEQDLDPYFKTMEMPRRHWMRFCLFASSSAKEKTRAYSAMMQ